MNINKDYISVYNFLNKKTKPDLIRNGRPNASFSFQSLSSPICLQNILRITDAKSKLQIPTISHMNAW